MKHGRSVHCMAMATKRSFAPTQSYNWHVIGLAETCITGKGKYDMEEAIKLIYSGEEEGGEA